MDIDEEDLLDVTLRSIVELLDIDPGLIDEYKGGPSVEEYRIDWDGFLDIWESLSPEDRTRAAQTKPQYNCYLLHLVCLCGAPLDVTQEVFTAYPDAASAQCKGLFGATPLHLASYFGSPQVVSLLLDPSLLLIKDKLGRLPLHLACRNSKQNAVQIVKLLLDADTNKVTLNVKDRRGLSPVAIASEYASEHVLSLLLATCLQADKMPENDFSLHDMHKDRPLHRAFHRRVDSPANVVRLLSTGVSTPNLKQADRRGQIPLHVACSFGAGASAFTELIENDPEGTTFSAIDAMQQTPADILLRRVGEGDNKVIKTLQDIAAADKSRRFFSVEDPNGQTVLDKIAHQLLIEPSARVQRKAAMLIYSCTPPGVGSYSTSSATVRKLLGETTFQKVYSDKNFHHTLNADMSKRTFTVYFMIDLYVRFAIVSSYTAAVNRSIRNDGETDGLFALTYLLAAYLLMWQAKTAWAHQLFYLREAWNLADLITTLLVVISSACFQAGMENSDAFRVLNVLTGGLVWIVTIASALRSTFLHFSVFVSGLTLILIYMIPYAITTILMLGAFGDMYFKSTYGTPNCAEDSYSDFCVYNQSFLKSYTMFVGGLDVSMLSPEASRNLLWLTIFYGFFFPVIMLTLLVAVIFDAWGKVSPQGRVHFWRYRHEFLIETSETPIFFNKDYQWKAFESLENHLEGVVKRFGEAPSRMNISQSYSRKIRILLFYVCDATYLIIIFVAGLLSASLLWPYAIRKGIFAPELSEADEAEDENSDLKLQIKALTKQVDQLKKSSHNQSRRSV